MSEVAAAGARLHVQELGAAATAAAVAVAHPPVVMLHGLLIGSAASWYFTSAPALAARHRVVVYDLRGHGRSEVVATGYDVRTMATDLAAVVEHAAPDGGAVDLVGHSWGALVALRYAIEHPARVRRLALVEPPVPPARVTEMAALASGGAEGVLAALPTQLRELLAGGDRRGARLLRSLERLLGGTTLLADLAAERDPTAAELATVRATCLVITGDASACAAGGAQLAVALGARCVSLPGGHYLHLDATAALTAALASFLDG